MIDKSWRSTLPSLLPSPFDCGLGEGEGLAVGVMQILGHGAVTQNTSEQTMPDWQSLVELHAREDGLGDGKGEGDAVAEGLGEAAGSHATETASSRLPAPAVVSVKAPNPNLLVPATPVTVKVFSCQFKVVP